MCLIRISKQQALQLLSICKHLREQIALPQQDKIAATRNFLALLWVQKEFQSLKSLMVESFQTQFASAIQQIQQCTDAQQKELLIQALQAEESTFFYQDAGFIDFMDSMISLELFPFSKQENSMADAQIYPTDSLIFITELALFS